MHQSFFWGMAALPLSCVRNGRVALGYCLNGLHRLQLALLKDLSNALLWDGLDGLVQQLCGSRISKTSRRKQEALHATEHSVSIVIWDPQGADRPRRK